MVKDGGQVTVVKMNESEGLLECPENSPDVPAAKINFGDLAGRGSEIVGQ